MVNWFVSYEDGDENHSRNDAARDDDGVVARRVFGVIAIVWRSEKEKKMSVEETCTRVKKGK